MRLLLIRLIDRKLPLTLRDNVDDFHREIAIGFVDACLGPEKFRKHKIGDRLFHLW